MGISVRKPTIISPVFIVRDDWNGDNLEVILSGTMKAIDSLIAPAGKIARFEDTETASLIALSDAVAPLLGSASIDDFVAALGTIPANQLPAIAITDTFAAASQAAMLALDAERGDIAVRSDLNKCYVLSADDPTVLGNWTLLLTPTDAVLSVAGLTGAISASALKTALAIASGDVSGLGALATASSVTASQISDASANGRSLVTATNYAAMKTLLGLVTVATSGAYADLSGKPTISTVGSTGAYADLTGKPTLGTAAALNVGIGASNVVQLDGSARLPAVDASLLLNLDPGNTPWSPGYLYCASTVTIGGQLIAIPHFYFRDRSTFVGSYNITTPSMIKDTSATWAAGASNGGMLQSGALAGTATFTLGSKTVAGVGTSFNSQFSKGDIIKPTATNDTGGQVASVESDTSLTLVYAAAATRSGVAYQRGTVTGIASAANATLFIHTLRKTADGSIDHGLAGTPGQPRDLPAGYTWVGRVAWWLTDAFGVLVNMTHIPLLGGAAIYRIKSPILDVNNQTLGLSDVTYQLPSAPFGIATRITADVQCLRGSGASTAVFIRNPSDASLAPSDTAAPLASLWMKAAGSTQPEIGGQWSGWADTFARVTAQAGSASSTFSMSITEIFDPMTA